jgi:hypothetical protein
MESPGFMKVTRLSDEALFTWMVTDKEIILFYSCREFTWSMTEMWHSVSVGDIVANTIKQILKM